MLRQYLGLLWQFVLLNVGIVVSTVSFVIFMLPFDIAPTGVTGVGVILNELFGISIGLVIFVLNIPLVALGYRYLGGMKATLMTIYASVVYPPLFEILARVLPNDGLSEDPLLNAIYAGVIGGIAYALVMRAGGTWGGTSVLATVINRLTGIPMSNTFLYADMGVVVAAGLVFGWESALYALVVVFINGWATDYVLEGPSVIRTVFIITSKPREVSDIILYVMERGVTAFEGQGMYSMRPRTMLYITIGRSQVDRLRDLVTQVDEDAFIVIGQAHKAHGSGFSRRRKRSAGPPMAPSISAK